MKKETPPHMMARINRGAETKRSHIVPSGLSHTFSYHRFPFQISPIDCWMRFSIFELPWFCRCFVWISANGFRMLNLFYQGVPGLDVRIRRDLQKGADGVIGIKGKAVSI